MDYRLKNSDFRPFLGALEGKVRDSGGVCKRGYGDIFWSVFVRGKYAPGGRGRRRGVKKLFIDRLREKKAGVLDGNRRGY